MAEDLYVPLESRGLLRLTGGDRVSFLQGLVSNDVAQASPDKALHTAFLTAQGKYLHDFFIAVDGDALMLDVEKDRLPDLMKRLKMYKLKSDITLTDASDDYRIAAVIGEKVAETLGLSGDSGSAKAIGNGVVFMDPRLARAGARAILPKDDGAAPLTAVGFHAGSQADYDRTRIALGLPDGSRDQTVDKAILLENGYDEMGSIAWDKGCYLGQELTARTRYRGLVKKRLVPVEIDGPLPEPGTAVTNGDKEVGEIRSGQDGVALALMRLEAMESTEGLTAGEAAVTPRKPDWATF
ncbi:folate-binding protein YgfZ [Magnetospira sp. QH-2]|uniref:CAF17-like 4Fe-4S cluster assembly/insertion protein YgfZ n=1 Tax=Magnetospira sp. (strain QH-2) TaxID=1288970 RepID=UPI0003E80B25|nr:folate-binding protein YgfZ [Magnetospira sp. QH-2]CCQ73901.1 Putative glycine cleavage T protein (Aminomethyl transferase) [Magnetospira sp. QH-2]